MPPQQTALDGQPDEKTYPKQSPSPIHAVDGDLRQGPSAVPFDDRTVLVTYFGRICIFKKKINLSTSLAGQAVGIKEVDDGIWLVSFLNYDLGYTDLEEKTLQPLDNPFGPRAGYVFGTFRKRSLRTVPG